MEDTNTDLRTCKKCNEEKPLTGFKKEKKLKSGYAYICKSCHSARLSIWNKAPHRQEKIKKNKEDFYKNNPNYQRDYHFKITYGITLEQYNEIFEKQNRACAICKNSDKQNWHLDHDHATGAVRGILCAQCNLMLGNAKDSEEILSNAVDYIKETKKMNERLAANGGTFYGRY